MTDVQGRPVMRRTGVLEPPPYKASCIEVLHAIVMSRCKNNMTEMPHRIRLCTDDILKTGTILFHSFFDLIKSP